MWSAMDWGCEGDLVMECSYPTMATIDTFDSFV